MVLPTRKQPAPWQAREDTTPNLHEARYVQRLLEKADVVVNGSRPWDIQVHDEQLYRRVLAGGSLALGKSYMDGWWSVGSIDQFMERVLTSDIPQQVKGDPRAWLRVLRAKLMNPQRRSRAHEVGEHHYDIGDELFSRMLDERIVYSCGYWPEGVETLDEAQEAKLDLICRKLGLDPGMRLLDIGCGWGSLALYAAEHYSCECVGLTVSQNQAKRGQQAAADRDLPVDIRLQDYRELNEQFDRAVSVGMFEHVGAQNYHEYMRVVDRVLKPGGLHMVHTIGRNDSARTGDVDPWIEKYIFPNGQLPSVTQIAHAAEGLFIWEDLHNFGADYDRTLMSWQERFQAAWPELRDRFNYTERFKRMWEYYLGICAAAFRVRNIQLWQAVFSKAPPIASRYTFPR